MDKQVSTLLLCPWQGLGKYGPVVTHVPNTWNHRIVKPGAQGMMASAWGWHRGTVGISTWKDSYGILKAVKTNDAGL